MSTPLALSRLYTRYAATTTPQGLRYTTRVARRAFAVAFATPRLHLRLPLHRTAFRIYADRPFHTRTRGFPSCRRFVYTPTPQHYHLHCPGSRVRTLSGLDTACLPYTAHTAGYLYCHTRHGAAVHILYNPRRSVIYYFPLPTATRLPRSRYPQRTVPHAALRSGLALSGCYTLIPITCQFSTLSPAIPPPIAHHDRRLTC